jgi:hypothetical protein
MFALCSIPEGVVWGDYFLEDMDFSVSTPVVQEWKEEGWEHVGASKVVETTFVRPARWCRNGNACQWANCKFRHERCEHYDKWVASRGKTRGCRCQQSDPRNCKSPEEGGCKYDHRDLSKLEMFVESVSITCEADMWEHFMQLGLEAHCGSAVDVTGMRKYERALLIRSLEAAGVHVIDNDTWLEVDFD